LDALPVCIQAKFLIAKSKEELERLEESKRIDRVNMRMSKIKLTFKRHCTEGEKTYGSVTSKNIADALGK
jgi:ribosomal protein L9